MLRQNKTKKKNPDDENGQPAEDDLGGGIYSQNKFFLIVETVLCRCQREPSWLNVHLMERQCVQTQRGVSLHAQAEVHVMNLKPDKVAEIVVGFICACLSFRPLSVRSTLSPAVSISELKLPAKETL